MQLLPSILVLLLVLLAACGGGEHPLSLSGNWQINLKNTATGAVKGESGFFVQSGSSLNGSLLLTGQTVCAGVGSVQGQVNGSTVTISVIQVGETVNLTGNADTGTSMSGDYSILASPCGNSQVGTWTGTQVKPIAGSLKATFTSTMTPGSVLNFTGTIAQGTNNGSSAATVSGKMSTLDSTCLSGVSIGGQISGTAIVLNLLSSEGISIGQLTGTTTSDATTITGTYNLFPQSTPVVGCHDIGTASITVQAGSAS